MALSKKNAETLEKYYSFTNSGDFNTAIQFLSDKVSYHLPGLRDKFYPFGGDWDKKEGVVNLFQTFNSHFGNVEMLEPRSISVEDEIFSFNDEKFTVAENGKAYRVGVIHNIKFDGDNKIISLNNYHDTYPARQAFANDEAITVPLPDALYMLGETEISDETAAQTVHQFYSSFPNADVLDDSAVILFPGDSKLLPIAGSWQGKLAFNNYAKAYKTFMEEQEVTDMNVVTNNGSVVATFGVKGIIKNTGEKFDTKRADFFQINKSGKIGRITIYVDTNTLTPIHK